MATEGPKPVVEWILKVRWEEASILPINDGVDFQRFWGNNDIMLR
jgi:hypothetical protein